MNSHDFLRLQIMEMEIPCWIHFFHGEFLYQVFGEMVPGGAGKCLGLMWFLGVERSIVMKLFRWKIPGLHPQKMPWKEVTILTCVDQVEGEIGIKRSQKGHQF